MADSALRLLSDDQPRAEAASAGAELAAVLSSYEPQLERCRERLRDEFSGGPYGSVLAAHVARGKLLRALLVHIYGAAVGGSTSALEPAADTVEILHAASLVHDDIIDSAAERRGAPALHVEVGRWPALVLGDYLLLRAFGVLARARQVQPAERVGLALERLTAYAQDCCVGEVGELLSPAVPAREEEYLDIVRGKTASQFAAAATLATLFAGGTGRAVEQAHTYGIAIGTAYQIRDDILDLDGDPTELGKPVGNSFSLGRPLLPLILLEQHGSGAARRRLRGIAATSAQRGVVRRLLEAEGILAQTAAIGRVYVEAAIEATSSLHPSRERDALRALAVFALERRV